jgi:hypothetical protein
VAGIAELEDARGWSPIRRHPGVQAFGVNAWKVPEALGQYEDNAGVLYNLACADALLGEKDAAIDHLRAAIEEQPASAGHARADEDFASIRDDPRFAELVGG